MFVVNVPISAVVLVGARRLLTDDRRRAPLKSFDAVGGVLSTAGALLLVYALVKAPDVGWSKARTIAELAGAAALLIAFVVNERRHRNPLVPFSIFRIQGLGSADATQVLAQAGFISMFFFITLYMQNVLGFSPIQTGLAYLPVTVGVGFAAGVSTYLLPRLGARPIIVAGALLGAGGVYWLSRIPVHGSYLPDLLPGLVVMAVGIGAVMVGVQNAANAGVPSDEAGLAAALITASATLGAALGLAILTAIATSRTQHLLTAHASQPDALISGFHSALIACSISLVLAAVIAARAIDTRGQPQPTVDSTPAAHMTTSRAAPSERDIIPVSHTQAHHPDRRSVPALPTPVSDRTHARFEVAPLSNEPPRRRRQPSEQPNPDRTRKTRRLLAQERGNDHD